MDGLTDKTSVFIPAKLLSYMTGIESGKAKPPCTIETGKHRERREGTGPVKRPATWLSRSQGATASPTERGRERCNL
jgi:hypothetical protein